MRLLKSKFKWQETEKKPYVGKGSGLHPEVEQLFLTRGLGTVADLLGEAADDIWHDPFQFKDMKKVLARIKKAIKNQESILVYGDYDADGVTSTAILVQTLRKLGAITDYYIPHRFFEGYGPNVDAFMQAVGEGHQLIITVDCGIAGVLEAQMLQENHVDLMIIDHHHPKEELPHALAIIHPEHDKNYPFNHLAGAGVTLKVAEALLDGQLEEDAYMLAMFGTVGDVVDLVDENRTIVKRGLSAFRKTKHMGVLALLKTAEINQYDADERTVGFSICPRLNAPGRMDDASMVVDLLLADDEFMAAEYAQAIESLNDERKMLTSQTTEQAMDLAKEYDLLKMNTLVLYQPHWHEGILGIVASKLVDKFGKVVIMLSRSDEGALKGSARAPAGFDLLGALTQNEALLEKYGGHQAAAGLTLIGDDAKALEQAMNRTLAGSIAIKSMTVDLEMPLEALDLKFLDDVAHLAPFGQGNKQPVVKISGVFIKNVKRIGGAHEHLKFTLHHEKNRIDAIYFNGADVFAYLSPDAVFDVLCEITLNEWNGNKKIQAQIIDMTCDHVQILDLRNQLLDAEFSTVITDGFIIDSSFESKKMLQAAYHASGAQNVVLKPLKIMSMPDRSQFVFVYQTIKQHGPFSLTPEIMAYFEKNGISRGMLGFVVKVFAQSDLIDYEKGTITLKEIAEKVDYKLAPAYVARALAVEVHEFLELTTAAEILKYMVGDE